MAEKANSGPDSTALRVALWRALHVEVDAKPPVLDDEIGLKLIAPEEGWKNRPDMNPQWTAGYRASIVGRARFVEDLVKEQAQKGMKQYVILGAGLDTFALREPKFAASLRIFEIDQPGTQAWKRQRMVELGYGIPEWLRFVPVDFEKGGSWPEQLRSAGFDPQSPAVVASTGVSMYLTKEAIEETLKQVSQMAPGTTLVMTFMLPVGLLPVEEQAQYQMVQDRARQSGTPFLSFFSPDEMLALAADCGFQETQHVSRDEIVRRYFSGRTDGLKPSNGEEFLVATV